MPQMAPLMWSTLYLAFTALMLICAAKIFFSLNKVSLSGPASESTPSTSHKSTNWKW